MRSASWPGRSSRVRCADCRTKGHSHGAGTPRIVRAGPSSVKGTPRSFLTAPQKGSSGPTLERRSLCQPSGPDGEGQARGQARNAHGEPTPNAPSMDDFPESRAPEWLNVDYVPMSWEWVASTATAAVGLAGIAATWLTARASRIDQRNMVLVQYEKTAEATLRDTRRKAYATLLADIYSLFQSVPFMHMPNFSENTDITLVDNLSRSLAEVRILGSDVVRQLAGQAAAHVLEFRAAAHKNADGSVVTTEILEAVNDSLYLLERMMAGDLGIPVNATMEEAERNIKTLEEATTIMAFRHGERQKKRSSEENPDRNG